MVYDNNRRCTGPVTGRFEGQTLLIDDTADLPCDDRYRILHRLARRERTASIPSVTCVPCQAASALFPASS